MAKLQCMLEERPGWTERNKSFAKITLALDRFKFLMSAENVQPRLVDMNKTEAYEKHRTVYVEFDVIGVEPARALTAFLYGYFIGEGFESVGISLLK